MREALEAALSRTEFWLQVFAVVVAVGVTGEAIFGVRLWLMGRRLRAIQQSEDLKNRTEIARLRAEAEGERLARVEIEEQLIRQGSRAALLYGENRMRLIEQLKAFAGQKVEVRYCGTSLNQYFVDDEVMSVAMLLHLVFSESGWFVNPLARANCGGSGLSIEIPSKSPESTRKAASALLSALQSLSIAVVGDRVYTSDAPRPPQPAVFDSSGREAKFSPLDADTVVVTVLRHP